LQDFDKITQEGLSIKQQQAVADMLFAYLRDILYDPTSAQLDTETIPAVFQELAEGFLYIGQCIIETQRLANDLARGNLDSPRVSPENELASGLKNLQSTLKHITWQVGQVAKGDYSQRLSFSGAFSESINDMIGQLRERDEALRSEIEANRQLARELQESVELLTGVANMMVEWIIVVDRHSGEWLYTNHNVSDALCDSETFHQLNDFIAARIQNEGCDASRADSADNFCILEIKPSGLAGTLSQSPPVCVVPSNHPASSLSAAAACLIPHTHPAAQPVVPTTDALPSPAAAVSQGHNPQTTGAPPLDPAPHEQPGDTGRLDNRDAGKTASHTPAKAQAKDVRFDTLAVNDTLADTQADTHEVADLASGASSQFFTVVSYPMTWHGAKALVFVLADITAEQREREQLENIAYFDALTGTYSRHYGMNLLDRWLAARADFILAFVDMDRLKYVNDTLGHRAGDEYILAVSRALSNLDSQAVVTRLGGDEFMVLCRDVDVDDIRRRLSTLRERLTAESPDEYVRSLSFGLIHVGKDNKKSASLLLSIADENMYTDKRSRKLQRRNDI
jgi:diguanylate cyclase (GGDEF)-like protein